jgi:hypothetical protein
MTTLSQYHGTDAILEKLTALQARRWALRVMTGVLAVGTVALGCVLVVALAAGYWPHLPPAALRWGLLVAALAALAGTAAWFLARAILWRQNPAQTARFVEQHLPPLRNDLINSILLARDREQVSPVLVQMSIREAAARLDRHDIDQSVSLTPIRRWGLALAAAACLVAAFALAQPRAFSHGLRAVLAPATIARDAADDALRREPIGEVEFLAVEPGNRVAFPGDPVTVTAEIENDAISRNARRLADDADLREQALAAHAERLKARVVFEGSVSARDMALKRLSAEAGRAAFASDLAKRAEESLTYAVQVGPARWPRNEGEFFEIHVLRVAAVDLHFVYPKYTGMPDRRLAAAGEAARSFEVPLGTRVRMSVRLSRRVREGGPAGVFLRLEERPPEEMAPAADGVTFSTELTVRRGARYRLEVQDGKGEVRLTAPEGGGFYEIRAIADEAPKLKFVSPNRDVSVAPGGSLALRVRMSDDYGLAAAALHAGPEGAPPKAAYAFPVAGKREGQFDYEFAVGPEYAQGDVIVYHATATDGRLLPGIGGAQTSSSAQFKILVQDADKLAAEKARRYEELRRRLLAILKMQEVQRVNTEICQKQHRTVDQVRRTGGEIASGQEAIKTALHNVAYKFPFDADLIAIQQATALLANNEAQLAIEQAKVLPALAALDDRDRACPLLAATQDKIIDTLQTLLAIMPSLANRKARSAAGEDLPADAREKLEELRKNLQDFIEAEKKVIEASKRLAKRPVDNFTAEDEKLLKELEAVQDKWEKFLNEQFTDFSKLAQQDFSNPSLLKELMAVKSDVTMAKDALAKKATEIATAIEDNGIENAESLTANIEKWLPDEPDRIKWAMEDPAGGQENVEQPELPTELEDLVGDLLEQEEDLFEEMDDVTSKYTMSGDKGIGWDAMDGPISNMNAQGVTGNQLPNTNELSGRSGEGRQGKSSGEFVEDKAVGKGGRRTPTRLSPEPFQKGQVNDESTDPPGGATGGGKMSGSGEEGLEGPVPPPLQQELKRLAGKQAALINRAERMRARFEVNDYSNFKFLEAITLMNRVRSDLENYRYRNVLRSGAETLGVIRQTRMLLAGEVDVTVDESATMPKYVREDIADAMKGELPEKFRDALREYYRRLSEQAGE